MELVYEDSMRAVLGLTTARQKIERLEAEIKALPQADIPTDHTFGPGFYCRTITVPEGGVLTGKVHSTEHIFLLTKGDMTLVTDEGKVRVQAPYQAICKAGVKRAGYAHAETVCTNIHITPETNLERLETLLIAPEKHLELESTWLG